jgi:hypothetical protein
MVGRAPGEQTVAVAQDGRDHKDGVSRGGNVDLLQLWTNGAREYRSEEQGPSPARQTAFVAPLSD